MKDSRTLDTARHFIKIAKKYAKFKHTEGYIEDNYSFYEVYNLDASLDICKRGPADYERFFFTGIIALPFLMLMNRELYGPIWQGYLVYGICYTALFLYWFLETTLMCHLEKRHWQKRYQFQIKPLGDT